MLMVMGYHSKFRFDSLKTELDVFQDFGRRSPIVEERQEFRRLVAKSSADVMLFEQAAHGPGKNKRIVVGWIPRFITSYL